jgi:hypothetical protein
MTRPIKVNGALLEPDEMAMGIVHPVTTGTTTKYK